MNMDQEAGRLLRGDRAIAAAEKVRFFNRAVIGGKGSELQSADGKRLIDLSATWTAAGLGYADPRIRSAVDRVLDNCPGLGLGSLINPQSVELAHKLLEITDIKAHADGADNGRVYFGHSGSDANDIALRLCRMASVKHGGGTKVLAFEHSYHGGFGKALGLSGVQVESGAKRDDNVEFLPYPNTVHPHVDGNAQDELAYCLHAVRQAMNSNVACLIVEPVLSDGGMIVPPDGFLSGLRSLCDDSGIPMICDEVKVGLGRPGTIHAYQYEGIHPDMVTFGKTLGGGLPISAIVGPSSILDCATGASLLTMGGNPICCAAAIEFLRILIDDRLDERADRLGRLSRGHLREAIDALPEESRRHITDIRGRGLAIGVELDDGNRSEQFAEKVCYQADRLGAVVYYVGEHVLEITPALTIDEHTLYNGLDLVVRAIDDVAAGQVPDDAVAGFGGW